MLSLLPSSTSWHTRVGTPAKSDTLHYAYPTFLNQAFPALPRPLAALERKPSTPRRKAKSAEADANLFAGAT